MPTYHAPTIEKLRQIVLPEAFIDEMKCRGPVSFLQQSGYVGNVYSDSFEFKRITNSGEYFMNENVAPPEVEIHLVKFKDVIWIDIDDPPVSY